MMRRVKNGHHFIRCHVFVKLKIYILWFLTFWPFRISHFHANEMTIELGFIFIFWFTCLHRENGIPARHSRSIERYILWMSPRKAVFEFLVILPKQEESSRDQIIWIADCNLSLSHVSREYPADLPAREPVVRIRERTISRPDIN